MSSVGIIDPERMAKLCRPVTGGSTRNATMTMTKPNTAQLRQAPSAPRTRWRRAGGAMTTVLTGSAPPT